MTLADLPAETALSNREDPCRVRLDKWLWYARFVKTRSQATRLCEAGAVRLGGRPAMKPHHPVRVGDVLTFPLGHHIRVIRVVDVGGRRGPAPQARALYEDLAPPAAETRLPG